MMGYLDGVNWEDHPAGLEIKMAQVELPNGYKANIIWDSENSGATRWPYEVTRIGSTLSNRGTTNHVSELTVESKLQEIASLDTPLWRL